MVKHCSILGCSSRANKEDRWGISFHSLPKDRALHEQWLQSIKRPIPVTEHMQIGSLHFVGEVKSSASSVPTIFLRSLSKRPPPKKWRQLTPPPTKQSILKGLVGISPSGVVTLFLICLVARPVTERLTTKWPFRFVGTRRYFDGRLGL